jgi:hypothetical protein
MSQSSRAGLRNLFNHKPSLDEASGGPSDRPRYGPVTIIYPRPNLSTSESSSYALGDRHAFSGTCRQEARTKTGVRSSTVADAEDDLVREARGFLRAAMAHSSYLSDHSVALPI